MKILYLTTPEEDYLQDQMLIGLRKIYDDRLVDFPKKNVMYESCRKSGDAIYGNGFTIWKILPDIQVDRSGVLEKVVSNVHDFQVVIFGSIWRQLDYFNKFKRAKVFSNKSIKFCFIDGQDHSRIFWPSIKYGKYYKRELRRPLTRFFVNKIGFSIPSHKIRTSLLEKKKTFATHVQCEEAYKISEINQNCKMKYAFSDEKAYYDDIGISKYGITMKKGGWDCMRHYELAANGTVPCFYQLSKKPKFCAPHGLSDMENVITFNSAQELTDKISHVNKLGLYARLQANAHNWAKQNSCERIAENLVSGLKIILS